MDILGDLTRKSRHNRFVLVITDRFSKLTVAIPLRTVVAASVFCHFDANIQMLEKEAHVHVRPKYVHECKHSCMFKFWSEMLERHWC